jgi:3-carboxy-cis,cis-muconate cycloisomerase
MDQQHERGLGNWQAELAEWPQAVPVSAHGALRALNEAFAGLQVDRERMLRNIDALHGLVFAEAASATWPRAIGRPAAHALLEDLSRAPRGGATPRPTAARRRRGRSAAARQVDPAHLASLFDPAAAAEPARRLASAAASLRERIALAGRNPPLKP